MPGTRSPYFVQILVAGLGALMLLISLLALDWRKVENEHGPRASAAFGLRSSTDCYGSQCRTRDYSWDQMKDHAVEKWLYISTLVTFLAGLVTACLVCVAAGFGGARPWSPARKTWGYIAFAATFVTCLSGAATGIYMGRVIEYSTVAAGYIVFILGAIAAAIGSFTLARAPFPAAPAVPVGTPVTVPVGTPVTVPACPQCRAPMQWVAQHNRWFCGGCQLYR